MTAKDCVAVGEAEIPGGAESPLLETWNGVKWTAASVKLLAGQSGGGLGSVSCVSAKECLVSGPSANGLNTVILLTGSGKSWAARSAPPGLYGLGSISCTTAYCVALGLGNGYVAATWNRSTWSEAKMAALKGSGDLELDSFSCVQPKGCIAVGGVYDEYPVAETWNGSKWTLARLPSRRGPQRATRVTSPASR